jgi:hypothetical protein
MNDVNNGACVDPNLSDRRKAEADAIALQSVSPVGPILTSWRCHHYLCGNCSFFSQLTPWRTDCWKNWRTLQWHYADHDMVCFQHIAVGLKRQKWFQIANINAMFCRLNDSMSWINKSWSIHRRVAYIFSAFKMLTLLDICNHKW